jgi:hypothetical protein
VFCFDFSAVVLSAVAITTPAGAKTRKKKKSREISARIFHERFYPRRAKIIIEKREPGLETA